MLNVALCMRIRREVRNFAWHLWFSLQRCCKTFCFVFINQRCAECVCLYTMDFVFAGKNTLLLYVTVCEKVVPPLNKHDDVIEWNFMKIAPPRNEELVAPLTAWLWVNAKTRPEYQVWIWKDSKHFMRRLNCQSHIKNKQENTFPLFEAHGRMFERN